MLVGKQSLCGKNPNGKISNAARSRHMRRFMMAASASAIALSAPPLLITPAFAQALPTGCADALETGTPNNNNGQFDAGETIRCVSVSNIPQISTAVDDPTIVVGDATTPTDVVGVPGVHTHGIHLTNGGAITINNAASSVSGEDFGIEVTEGVAATDDITIVSQGAVTSSNGVGINVLNDGTGSIDIDVARVAGEARGIRASNTNAASGNISVVTSALASSGGGAAVRVSNSSATGDTYLSIAGATGGYNYHTDGVTLGDGISVNAAGRDLTINATSSVYGSEDGIEAVHTGYGSATVSTTVVNGRTGNGISVASSGSEIDISAATGIIVAGQDGVIANNTGSGATTVSVNNVNAGASGVSVSSSASTAGDATVTANGTVTSGADGIEVSQAGSGDVTVTANDAVDAGGHGVDVYMYASATGNVTVTASGTIDADDTGVHIYSNAASTTGAVNVDVHNVNAGTDNTDHGVYIRAAGSSVTVDAGGDVYATETITGGGRGVWVNNDGTGATTITVDTVHTAGDAIFADVAASATGAVTVEAQGSITSDSGSGVSVRNNGSGNTDITVNQVDATAGNGIVAVADSAVAGNLSVTANGAVNAGNFGLVVQGGGAVSVSVETVTANQRGLIVTSEATSAGNVTVAANGAITSTNNTGVYIRHGGSGSADVDVANVYAGSNSYSDGIHVTHAGYNLSIDAEGAVTAGRHGVNIRNNGSGATAINVDNITTTAGAGSHGIYVDQNSGSVTIDADGLIDAAGHGVFVDHDGAGALDVTVDNVKSGETGIWVDEDVSSSSDIKIKAYGYINASSGVTVVANGAGNVEIDVDSINSTQQAVLVSSGPSSTGDLTVRARAGATLTSTNDDGIHLLRQGTGNTSVYVDAVSAGTGADDDGVFVRHLGDDLTISSTGLISAGGRGVWANNDGTGGSDITLHSVDAGGTGVEIYSGATTTGNVTVTASGTIDADDTGVHIYSNAASTTGAVNVDVHNVNAGTDNTDHGVYIRAAGSSVTVDAGGDVYATETITGGGRGVWVNNDGTGATTITVDTVHTAGDAIFADVAASATGAVTVEAQGSITSDSGSGVSVRNNGSGNTDITVNQVDATAGNGIVAVADSAVAGNLSVTANGAVNAGNFGLVVQGGGAVSVSVETVTANQRGLIVTSEATSAGNVTVAANGAITSTNNTGVYIRHGGSGSADVDVANVYAGSNSYSDGIHVTHAGYNLSIDAEGAVTAGRHGVNIRNNGSGATAINVDNITTTAGAGSHGIYVDQNSGSVTIDADGLIDAAGHGVFVDHDGAGALDVTVDNVKSGETGIWVDEDVSSSSDIKIKAYGYINASSGVTVVANGAGNVEIDVDSINSTQQAVLVSSGPSSTGDLTVRARAGATLTSTNDDGIHLLRQGTGNTSVYVDAVSAGTGADDDGVFVRHLGDDLTISSTGLISAGGRGVWANNDGTGGSDITLHSVDAGGTGVEIYSGATTTGAITLGVDYGISAGAGGVIIDQRGAGNVNIGISGVTGRGEGVNINQMGNGDISFYSDGAITMSGNGVVVNVAASTAGDVDVEVKGGVTSTFARGVLVDNAGSGSIDIDVANVSGLSGGVRAVNTSAASDGLTITSSGTISLTSFNGVYAGNNSYGVYANNEGAGATRIDVLNVDANSGTGVGTDGVRVYSSGTDLAIYSDGTIAAGRHGIVARNDGTGAAIIDVVNVYAGTDLDQNGIYVKSAGTDLTIDADGTITAGGNGIFAVNNGTGATSINVVNVYAGTNAQADGVFVRHRGAGGFSIDASGSITAGRDGVAASLVGASDASTISVNAVTSGDKGIFLFTDSATSSDLTIEADGAITAGGQGVRVDNLGSGSLSINVGDVATDLYGGDAIRVNNSGSDLSITSTTGNITSDEVGIFATHRSAAKANITVNTVTAGVDGFNVLGTSSTGSVGDISVKANGLITAQNTGVTLRHFGSGSASITVTDVSGGFLGVLGQKSYAGDLTIRSDGTVYGGGDGVRARAGDGVETISIHVNNVTAGRLNAIDIESGAGTIGDFYVTADGVLTAAGDGVYIGHTSNGVADVSVNSIDADGRGVYVNSTSTATGDINITTTATSLIDAGADGVRVNSLGSGSVAVGVYNVTSANEAGVSVYGGANVSQIDIAATGHVSGYYAGVEVDHRGVGATTISVNTVYAEYGAGVSARTTSGAGALSITAAGLISAFGADASDAGIGVNAYVEGDGVTVNAADIYGELYGVNIFNAGGGAVTVSAANVTGQYYQGVKVDSRNGTDVAVTATGLVSGYGGVDIFNAGNGSTTVNVHDATGTYYDGVSVFQTTPHDVRVTSTGDVTGARDGIRVAHFGPADTFITAANVSGGYRGVYARSFSGGDIAIDADNVSGANIGIVASTTGGNIAVTSTGTVSSVNDAAIALFTDTVGRSDISVDAATVAGDVYGVFAFSANDGSLSIAADTISSAAGRGVYVYNLAGETDIAITSTGAIIGQLAGVDIANLGGGATTVQVNDVTASIGDGVNIVQATPHSISVTATGLVSGGDNGIEVLSVGGAEITISEGGSVTGAVAAIRLNGAAGDVVNLNSGGSIAGDVLLLDGDDTFTDASGQFTTVFGGDGTDTVNFEEGAARTIDGSGQAGDSLQEHEIFNFNAGGFTLAGDHTGLSETSFNTGTNRLTGSLTSAQTIVAPGATLNKAHGSVIVGDLDVHGTLDIGDSPGTSTVDGDVVFGASSILPIETLGDEHDVLIVTGSVTLDGELQIIHLGDVDVGTMQRTIIDGGSGLNGAHASVSGEGGLLISNSVDFDPSGFDLVLTTTVNSAWSVDGLADDELNVGNHLVDLIAQPSLDPELAGLINAVGAVPDAEDLRQILAELHPEGFDAGLRFLANSQGRFTSNIIDVPAHAVRRAGPGDAHVWASIDLSRFSSNDHRRHIGFDGDAYEFSAGVSGLGRGPVTVGFAGGYATFSGDTLAGLRDEFDVSLYRLAASARVAVGAAGANGYVDSVVSFAKGENELAMTVIDPVSDAQTAQSGTADISSVGFSTRFTMTGVNGRDWPVRPHAEIGIDSVRQDAVAISGGSGATALAVEKLDSARAYIALGAAFDRRLTKALSLNASAEGVRYFSDTENVIEARFLAAPEDVPAFRTVGANVEWQARLQAGASYEHASGLTLSADGFAEAGDVKTYGARLELSRRF